MQRSRGFRETYARGKLCQAAVVTVLAMVSCRNSTHSEAAASTASATSAAASVAAAASPCTLVSPAEAAAALGLPALKAPEIQSVPPVTMCSFDGENRSGALTLRFETGRSLGDMATIRKGHDDNGQPTTALPGLGDAAFTFSLGPIHGVSTLGKGTVVLVMGHSPLDKLEQLARTILQRL